LQDPPVLQKAVESSKKTVLKLMFVPCCDVFYTESFATSCLSSISEYFLFKNIFLFFKNYF
jgi:hypothetical protein